ncbi:MAG: hypothetical protein FJ293_00735 [Planctomycetes bacterium]|nr:hypothetical protein [Planctomycetota bacterium]
MNASNPSTPVPPLPPPANQRKTVLIDRAFQLGFIRRLGGALCFYFLLFVVIAVVAPVAFTFLGHPPEWAMMETAFRVEVLLRIVLAPLICTFICLFAHGVLETFRIAGPNFRFRALARDLQRLRIPRGVRIRKGDLLQDTADELHRGLIAVHDQLTAVKSEVVAAIEQTRGAMGPARSAGADQALAALARAGQAITRFELVGCAPECAREMAETMPPVEPLAADATVTSGR